MRHIVLGLVALIVLSLPAAARDPIRARVDLSEQTMDVDFGDGVVETWTISSGKRGEETPTGRFRGYLWSRDHVSSIYGLGMPFAVFVNGNIAVHASNARLGRPASHGCIRLSVENARRFFNETRRRGLDIEIVGSIDEFYALRGERAPRRADRASARSRVSESRSDRAGRSTERSRTAVSFDPDSEFRPRSMRY
jgi:hypothetical protein